MPLYDYDCAACGRRFEVIHGVHADPPSACPLCGSGPVRKAIAAPAIHFKGSGWAKKERRAGARSGTAASSAEGEAAEVGSGAGSGTTGAAGDDARDAGSGPGGPTPPSTTTKSSSSAPKTAGANGD